MFNIGKRAKAKEFHKDNSTLLGEGYSLTDKTLDGKIPRPRELYVPDADRSGHMWCFGTTRVGKTKIIENMVEQDIRKGYSVIVIDPKGEISLFSKIVQIAEETGRIKDQLMLMTPICPDCSVQINPLSHYSMSEELVGHVVSGIDIGKEKFFFNVAYEISLVIVQAMILTGSKRETHHRKAFNLNDIKNRVSKDELKTLQGEVDEFKNDSDSKVADYATQLSLDIKKIIDSPQDYYSKISSNLRVALMELTSGNIGKIVGTARSNKLISKLEKNEPVIFAAHLGAMITRRAASTLGKVIISMLQSFVGRRLADGGKVTPPLCLYIDEAQDLLYHGIDNFFAKAGAADVWIHGFAQSVSQLYAQIGKDYGRTILDNTNTKLFMRVPDADTASYVADHFGEKKKYESILNSDGGITVREQSEDIVSPSDILNLKARTFYLMTYGGNYKGKSIESSPSNLEVIFPYAGVVDHAEA